MADSFLSGHAYLAGVADLASLAPPIGIESTWSDRLLDAVSPNGSIIVTGLGGSFAAACFFSRCLIDTKGRHAYTCAFDELEYNNADNAGTSLIVITASGQNPSTLSLVTEMAERNAPFWIVTLNPDSPAAGIARTVGADRLLVPATNLYQQEYIATRNLANLILLGTMGICGSDTGAKVCDAVTDKSLGANDSVMNVKWNVVTRVVVIADYTGKSAALDFSTRCREFATLAVTELGFSDFVHGSHMIARSLSALDHVWLVVFAKDSRAGYVARLLRHADFSGSWSVVPIAGIDAISQARGIAASIRMHYSLVSRRWETWEAKQDQVGDELWKSSR